MLGILPAVVAFAQPVLNSKEILEGIPIYKDHKKSNLFYHGPGALALAKGEMQRPEFQLTQMRYTGTSCAGDQGENHFLNLVQFSLEMETLSLEDISKIKAKLKSRSRRPIELLPMPLRYVQTYILLPVASNKPPQRVASEGVADADPEAGSIWKKKNFNFRLTNAESQLLSRQIQENHLSISVGYSFYADALLGEDGEMTLSGSREEVEELLESNDWAEMLRGDTLAMPRLFHAGTMTFDLSLKDHPDFIKKIDINEGLPPDYPALEIRCYDFRDNLRPDLALKRVEIAGVGVGGKPLRPQAVQFAKRSPQEYVKNFRFPFAVKMDEDIQYRLTSYTLKGERKMTEWISRPVCEGLIDLTTPPEENPLRQVSLAFETDQASLDSAGVDRVEVLIGYKLDGKAHLQQVEMRQGQGFYAEISFVADKGSKTWYRSRWKDRDQLKWSSPPREINDSYYFLQVK